MMALRLDDNLLNQIDYLAKHQHTNRSTIIRQAIIQFLEDFEDVRLAASASKKVKSTKSLAQLRKELGLDS